MTDDDCRNDFGSSWELPSRRVRREESAFIEMGSSGEELGFRLARTDDIEVIRGIPWTGRSEFMPEVGRVTSRPDEGMILIGFRVVWGTP